jgi:thiosulfate/3-mercaptopyruvate sulfurtransferase
LNNDLLVNSERLAQLMADGQCVVVDCRFDLADEEKGRADYLANHIPGAHYAHLGEDLSSPTTSKSGRHPLPDAQAFAVFLGRIGWAESKLLVAHDDRNNAMAVRLWWLMRYFGKHAALLDGGLEAWTRAGMQTETGPVQTAATPVPELAGDAAMIVSAADVLNSLEHKSFKLIDARAPDRFSGTDEPLDNRAGHIPGAVNRPFTLNLDEFGCFRPSGQLRAEFEAMLGSEGLNSVVHYCGSGVTACHNRFAMEFAGITAGRVYPGSWSEWSRDENRPIEISA